MMTITIEQKSEVYTYFLEQYRKAPFRMLPGDIPVFHSREDVDKWIATFSKLPIAQCRGRHVDDPDDF